MRLRRACNGISLEPRDMIACVALHASSFIFFTSSEKPQHLQDQASYVAADWGTNKSPHSVHRGLPVKAPPSVLSAQRTQEQRKCFVGSIRRIRSTAGSARASPGIYVNDSEPPFLMLV